MGWSGYVTFNEGHEKCIISVEKANINILRRPRSIIIKIYLNEI